jgi:Cu/Ag efflux protein CusF
MKQVVTLFLAVFLLMSGIAVAQQTSPTEMSSQPGSMERSRLMTTTATVESVDMQNRMVTLRGPRGGMWDIKVGEDVRNLSQVKPGDQVRVKYYESIALSMAKPGEQGTTVTEGTMRSAPGEQPAGAKMEQVSTTATIQSIDKNNNTVTLKGPEGKVVTVKARDPRTLDRLKVGDQINITYTQAMAVSLEKMKG